MNFIISMLVGATLACACTPAVPADAGAFTSDGGPAALCAHLNAIGCAQLPNCESVVAKVEEGRITDLHEAQLLRAQTKTEAVAVGSVTCQ